MSAIFELLPADPDQLQAALVDYLDNLLHADLTPAPAPVRPEPAVALVVPITGRGVESRRHAVVEAPPAPIVLPLPTPVLLPPLVLPEPAPVALRAPMEPVVLPPVVPPPIIERPRLVVPAPVPTAPVVKPVQRLPQRPEWLLGGCTCLAFQVGGLELLAPLIQLGQVIPLHDPLHFLQGQPDVQLGVMVHLGRTLAVMDLARVLGRPATTAATHVLSLPDSRIALAVDAIIGTQEIGEADVQLRGRRRGVIVGTHRESLRPLLDVTALRWLNGRPVL